MWWFVFKNHIPSNKIRRPRCYTKPLTVQDVFRPISGLISCAGVTRRWGQTKVRRCWWLYAARSVNGSVQSVENPFPDPVGMKTQDQKFRHLEPGTEKQKTSYVHAICTACEPQLNSNSFSLSILPQLENRGAMRWLIGKWKTSYWIGTD